MSNTPKGHGPENDSHILEAVTELFPGQEVAEAASRVKNDFLTNISHEIRTPMNVILGMSNLLNLTQLSEQQRGYVDNILTASQSLLALINDILDFSKINAQKLELTPHEYDTAQFISNIANVAGPRAAQKGLVFTVDTDPELPARLYGDHSRIRQAVVHLLTNAVKYTAHGGISLRVSFEPDEHGRAFLVLRVEDTGAGIPADRLPQLFDSFSQLANERRGDAGGAGLGLAASKGVIAAMDGDIDVSSEHGKGSVFTIRVPQNAVGEKKIVHVDAPGIKRALVFGSGPAADALCRALSSVFVKHTLADTVEAFESAIETQTYTHVFFWHELGGEAVRRAQTRLHGSFMVAVHGVSGASAHSYPNTLHEPLLLTNIARMLAGHGLRKNSDAGKKDGLGSFKTRNARALIVDDNEINLLVAAEMLSLYGLAADTADGGEQAIGLCERQQYDIIFMDHMMPGMDGIEAATHIRALSAYANVPIIVLTANAVVGAREHFLHNGLDDYLSKPINVPELSRILLDWLAPEKIVRDSAEAAPLQEVAIQSPVLREIAQRWPLDISGALKQIGGSEDTYLIILRTFCDNAVKKFDLLSSLRAASDWNGFRIEAHGQKSAMNNIGALSLSEKARKLELAAEKDDIEYIQQHTGAYVEEAKSLSALLGGLLPTREKASRHQPASERDHALLMGNLREVVAFLDLLENEAALNTLSATLSYDYGPFINQSLDNVLAAVEGFDYDAASAIIKTLIPNWKEGADA